MDKSSSQRHANIFVDSILTNTMSFSYKNNWLRGILYFAHALNCMLKIESCIGEWCVPKNGFMKTIYACTHTNRERGRERERESERERERDYCKLCIQHGIWTTWVISVSADTYDIFALLLTLDPYYKLIYFCFLLNTIHCAIEFGCAYWTAYQAYQV